MSTPIPHPAAFVASPDCQDALVIALANPFALRWIPATLLFDMTFGNDNPQPTGIIHGGNSPQSNRITETHWYQIVVQAKEFAWDPATTTFSLDELKQLISSQGTPSSILKVRLELALGYSQKRFIDVDIGAGICTFVSCKYINSIRVLVPDPTSIPTFLPEAFPVTANVATKITTRIHCDWCPGPRCEPLYWTQTYFMNEGGQEIAYTPIVAAAKELVVLSDPIFDVTGLGTFINSLSRPLLPQYGPPPLSFPVGGIDTPPTEHQSSRAPIPGTANGFTYTTVGAGAVSIVQVLQL